MEQSVTMQLDQIFRIIEILILPALWKIYTTLAEIQRRQFEQTNETTAVKNILIGVDGRNGIRSRVIQLERQQAKTNITLAKQFNHTPVDEDGDDDDV